MKLLHTSCIFSKYDVLISTSLLKSRWFTCSSIVAQHFAWLHRWRWGSSTWLYIHRRLRINIGHRIMLPLPGFFPSWSFEREFSLEPEYWAESFKSPSRAWRERSLDSSEVLGLLRLALWPPAWRLLDIMIGIKLIDLIEGFWSCSWDCLLMKCEEKLSPGFIHLQFNRLRHHSTTPPLMMT